MKQDEDRKPLIEEEEEEEEEEKVHILHTTPTTTNENRQTAFPDLKKNSELVTTSVRLPRWILLECENRGMHKSLAARKALELFFMQQDEEKSEKVEKKESELELLGRQFFPLWKEWFVLKGDGDSAILMRASKWMKEKKIDMGSVHFELFLEKMKQWYEEGRFNEEGL